MIEYDYLFKIIMVGSSNVGKSCLLMRFVEDKFRHYHQPSLGVEFGSRIMQLNNGATTVKLQVWDTVGQECFISIARSYYKMSIGAILVYDVTSESSFDSLSRWIYELRTYSNEKCKIVLVGNKTDLQSERKVSRERALQFCRQNAIPEYYETSAKSGDNVAQPFLYLSNQVMTMINDGTVDPDKDLSRGVRRGKKGNPKPTAVKMPNLSEPSKPVRTSDCAC